MDDLDRRLRGEDLGQHGDLGAGPAGPVEVVTRLPGQVPGRLQPGRHVDQDRADDLVLDDRSRVGVFGLALMRAAFGHALRFAQAEKRGGPVPVIDHQAIGYALASAKTRIEAVRSPTWRACHVLDTGAPAARELTLHAKIFGSETAVAVITDLMQVVEVDSYGHDQPFGRLLRDPGYGPDATV